MKLLKGTALILAGMLLCSCAAEHKISKQEVAESISDISSDEEGNVSIVLEDGRVFSLGNLKGEKGKDGEDGETTIQTITKNGKDGSNGIDGKNGADGKDGSNGKDGKNGIDGKNGSNGLNGKDGKDGISGKDGVNGKDGIGIKNSTINNKGELIITYTDNSSVNLGVVKNIEKFVTDLKVEENALYVYYSDGSKKKLDLKKVIYATPDPGVRPEPTAEPTQEPTPEPIEPTIAPTPEASDFGW
ncbi:MAG: hypothetical protein UC361_05915 [Bulleidia sp.]|nr:hypothetical protein [Bulleidia sp.]